MPCSANNFKPKHTPRSASESGNYLITILGADNEVLHPSDFRRL
jgi:hypothetical protein